MPASIPLNFLDKDRPLLVTERRLPHWAQAGTVCFLTWRTWDSMPTAVIESWLKERCEWLLRKGINATSPDWKHALRRLPQPDQKEFHRLFTNRWEDMLDECHGTCVLRQPDLATIVSDSLHHFDDDRYLLTDFVVMPNHVHILASFASEERMLMQCESWKHYTAVQLNKKLGRKGRFWQKEGFDHLVRSEEQFVYFRTYIATNPEKARLKPGESIRYARTL